MDVLKRSFCFFSILIHVKKIVLSSCLKNNNGKLHFGDSVQEINPKYFINFYWPFRWKWKEKSYVSRRQDFLKLWSCLMRRGKCLRKWRIGYDTYDSEDPVWEFWEVKSTTSLLLFFWLVASEEVEPVIVTICGLIWFGFFVLMAYQPLKVI